MALRFPGRVLHFFHLLFADDLMLFAGANASKASTILSCLSKYPAWFGQKDNISKSSNYLSKNCNFSFPPLLTLSLVFVKYHLKPKYLGLPLFFHHNKNQSLMTWRPKSLTEFRDGKLLLSQAARTTLIKTVANAIPSYTMSLSLLPKSLYHDIDSSLRRLWWVLPSLRSTTSLWSVGIKFVLPSPWEVSGWGLRNAKIDIYLQSCVGSSWQIKTSCG
jgi:hypothetical protein